MNPRRNPGLVFAVHPTSKGFGWVIFEDQNAPVGWGISSAKANRSATSMRRFQALLDQYHPSVLVLEAFKGSRTRRGPRIQDLAQTMSGFAANRDIDVVVYSRNFVSEQVAENPHATRHAIAKSVAGRIPIFRLRMPRERELWQSEDARQCLFDAAALAMTHFAVSRRRR
jgi:hypothetical protein